MKNKELIVQLVEQTKEQFEEFSKGLLEYQKEVTHLYALLKNNPDILNAALADMQAFKNAWLQVAMTGLTINLEYQYAFIGQKNGHIYFDITYKGIVKIAIDAGVIKWAIPHIYCVNDTVIGHGPLKHPEHSYAMTGDRGVFAGVYCITRLADGTDMTHICTADEIMVVRDQVLQSTEYPQFSAWTMYFNQMAEKTCIKRAAKHWPAVNDNERFVRAISILNENEGVDFQSQKNRRDVSAAPAVSEPVETEVDEQIKIFAQQLVSQVTTPDSFKAAQAYIKERLAGAELTFVQGKLDEAMQLLQG